MAILGPVVAVGVVIWRGPDQLLLVRRKQPPRLGEWSLPGGRVERGESLREALIREVREETGLAIDIAGLADVVDLIEPAASGAVAAHYVLIDFNAHWLGGEARAASDAAECGWFSPEEAIARVVWDETRRIIRASAGQVWHLNCGAPA